MKIFLDSLDVNLIKKYADIGLLSGITTNPTFSRRYGMHDDIEMVAKVRQALGKEGEIHVEAFGDTKDEILKSADRLANTTKDENLVYKVPFTEQGVSACAELVRKNMKTNLHLIFSLNQAMLAASIKSTYICPLAGRLDDSSHPDAMDNIRSMLNAYKANAESTMVMVSSVRHPQHVLKAYEYGADAITIPANTLAQIFYHPLTDTGIHIFRNDIEAIKPISSRTINSNLIANTEDTLRHCLSLMVVHKSGAIAVCSDKKLAGVFTMGDLKRLVQQNIRFDLNDKIGQYMHKEPITVDISESTAKAQEIMRQYNIDHLVVVDGDAVAGIIDLKELSL